MNDELRELLLRKELEMRGIAEVTKEGKVLQATQAIEDEGDTAKVIIFGTLQEFHITPIEKCCAVCKDVHFGSIEACQGRQKKDARARGFANVICPQQLSQ